MTTAGDDTNLGRQIDRILFNDWDPIGINDCGCPSDEYSSYVPSVLRLLKDGASVQRISDLLQHIAQESIGLSSTKPEVNMLVAQKLQALLLDSSSSSSSSSHVDVRNERTARSEDDRLVIPPVNQPLAYPSSFVVRDEDRLFGKISGILYHDWDPLGLNDCSPSDEYEDYVPPVLRLLKNGATVHQISVLLYDTAKKMFGMDTSTEFNTLVAQKLCLLMDSKQVDRRDQQRTVRAQFEQSPPCGGDVCSCCVRLGLFNPPVIQPRLSQQPSTIVVSDQDRLLGYKISAVLFNDWDPIGMNDFGLLPDEYDIHVPSILRLLKDGANEQQIGKQLQEIASEKMGLHTKAQVNMLVAKKLRTLIMENQGAVAERNIYRMDYDRNYIPPAGIQRSSSGPSSDMEAEDTHIRGKINSILFHDWDPIGYHDDGMPEDEYSSYVPSILRLLKDGASVQSISDLLHKIAKESIDMPVKPEVNMSVAKKLRALMYNDFVVDDRNDVQPQAAYRWSPYAYAPVYPDQHGPYNEYCPSPIRMLVDDQLCDKINDILYYAWDPIGMKYLRRLPRDEYKSYAPSVLSLMQEGANVWQISELLHKIAKDEKIGIDTKEEVNMLVAKKLLALMYGYSFH